MTPDCLVKVTFKDQDLKLAVARDTCLKFSFDGPIKIYASCLDSVDGQLIIVVSMSTINSCGNGSMINVELSRILRAIQWLPLSDGSLRSFVACTIRDMVREMWTHEMHEWLRYDGEKITDPHAVDHEDL